MLAAKLLLHAIERNEKEMPISMMVGRDAQRRQDARTAAARGRRREKDEEGSVAIDALLICELLQLQMRTRKRAIAAAPMQTE